METNNSDPAIETVRRELKVNLEKMKAKKALAEKKKKKKKKKELNFALLDEE